jgi:hypothetical protein
MRTRGILLASTALALALLATAACRQPEQPTVPPRPINPTNGPIAYEPQEVTDASIVSDAGITVEAAIGRMDGGAGSGPH